MRSLTNEIDVETLRARYAELLRLREYVEQLEALRNAKCDSCRPADGVQGQQRPGAPRVVSLFG